MRGFETREGWDEGSRFRGFRGGGKKCRMWLDGHVEVSRYLCAGLIFLFVFVEILSDGARGSKQRMFLWWGAQGPDRVARHEPTVMWSVWYRPRIRPLGERY